MTTKSDFLKQGTLVFSCGLDNRDPQKGYVKESSLEDTPFQALLTPTLKQPPLNQNDTER